jgi:hypothetical protein
MQGARQEPFHLSVHPIVVFRCRMVLRLLSNLWNNHIRTRVPRKTCGYPFVSLWPGQTDLPVAIMHHSLLPVQWTVAAPNQTAAASFDTQNSGTARGFAGNPKPVRTRPKRQGLSHLGEPAQSIPQQFKMHPTASASPRNKLLIQTERARNGSLTVSCSRM